MTEAQAAPLLQTWAEEFLGKLSVMRQTALRGSFELLEVSFNPRLRGTAGHCRYGNPCKISLNPLLLCHVDHLRATFGHELAHFAVYVIGPPSAHHGPDWQLMMHEFGLPARKTHSYGDLMAIHMVKAMVSCMNCGKIGSLNRREAGLVRAFDKQPGQLLIFEGTRCRRCGVRGGSWRYLGERPPTLTAAQVAEAEVTLAQLGRIPEVKRD